MTTTSKMEEISSASLSHSPESPSFTTFSSENIADIAARVVKELNLSHHDPYDDVFYSYDVPENQTKVNDAQPQEQDDGVNNSNDDDDDDDDEGEFEFAILCGEDNSSPISADEIFSNGQIKPTFPLFNTDLVFGYNNNNQNGNILTRPESHSSFSQTIRLPLRKLIMEERESGNGVVSCSSSEADDLEGVPPGTYCVWTPKKKEEIMMRKKSKSTGSSKRWRFRDLLYRSNSDGKDTFVFLTPSNHHKAAGNGGGSGGDERRKEKMRAVGGTKRGGYDGGKKKSYLPYRQDLVGLFSNVNGISRTVRPF